MGPAVEITYEAQRLLTDVGPVTSGTLMAEGLVSGSDTNVDIITEESSLTENHPVFKIGVNNAAVNQGGTIYRYFDHRNIDDAVIVAEFKVLLTAVGASGVDVAFGFNFGIMNSVPTTNAHVLFQKLASDTNWYTSVAETTQTRLDLGTPPTASTYQTFRVEYHGANTPLGVDNTTAPVARFFLNGVLEDEVTNADVPVGPTTILRLAFVARADGTGPTSDFELEIGPIRYAYNQELDAYIPS